MDSNCIGVHVVSELAWDFTPRYLEAHGFKSIPKSVQYGYTASGYGLYRTCPMHTFMSLTI